MNNNLEVFMKRIFLGMFLAVSLWGFAGCAEYDGDEESVSEQCRKDPSLPICEDVPQNQETEQTPSNEEDF